jgi:hypothetical protein
LHQYKEKSTQSLKWAREMPMLFLWGAVAFGVYTVALAELGDRFSGSMLLAGNATFAMMWGIGGIVGDAPRISGSKFG